jgi:drug/metabolite transporter (DMT)-like permease
LFVFCAVGVVVFYAALPLAIETGGISLAWVLLYTAPVWVSIGAALFLGERVGVAGGFAVGVSVGGVVALVSSVGGTVDVTGAVPTYAVTLPVGGVVLALIVGLDAPSIAMVPWLLLVGVGCTYLPYLAFGLGIQDLPSSRAVVIATVEPVVAILIGVAVYGETLGVVGVLGGAAVLAAAITVGLRRA